MTTRAGTSARAGRAQDCFHCGLPVPAGTAFGHEADGRWRAFCCAGCEAVSRSITGLGLDDYYRLREARAAPGAPRERDDLAAFDEPAIRGRFVRSLPGGLDEAEILLEGLRCAACAWLVEQSLARLVGVTSAEVHYSTRRARVRFDPSLAKPSDILSGVARVGYSAWPYEEGRLALVESRERRTLLRRLWVAGLGMMQVMMYAYPAYIAAEGEITADIESLMRWAGLLLTLPVIGYSAGPFFAGSWRDLRLKRLGMEVPIALGLAVAFLASAWSTVSGAGAVYFDSVTMFVFLLLGGRYLELLARMRAGRSLQHLARLVPRTALRLARDDALDPETVPVAALRPGDRVLVKPGESVPADGELESDVATLGE
ncbi:MAG TPA: heavy metal translocating P-type ATPase metal-binding domain-containing protein, partial [Usitatibacter sp.]|nr:heavy metal translocating P-type ATPase metal-binding domain-containing protein [Usitatibacter sp.]